MTINNPYRTLREATDDLGLESWRAGRLARFLKISPSDRIIPEIELQRIKAVSNLPEEQYKSLLAWLLCETCGKLDSRHREADGTAPVPRPKWEM